MPCRLSVSLLLFSLITLRGNAQCPITVDAGPDQYACNPGATVELQGNISGSYIGFRWTPATGLSSPNVLNPTATVNGTATYTLSGAAVDPSAPNLVVNPAFEFGNTGFTSGYTYNPTPVTPGTYVLTTSPSLVVSTFPPCDDHTYGNGTGNMMLVNGNGSANSQIWCQTIPVMPNSWYFLSAWVIASPISPPVMQFYVNGAPAGSSYTVDPGFCNWQEFTAAWYSGAASSATFCINDISGSGNGLFGDDFALDDISVTKACSASDQVTVSVVSVNAVLPNSIVLPCNAAVNGIQLNGSASSSGPGYTYSWDGPGILSGANTPVATVNEPGQYTLTVSFDTGNGLCTDEAVINVLPDPNVVTANANSNDDLTCTTLTVQLSGAGSSVGPNISYAWQPASGVVSGINTLNPVVNQPGEYTLTVTNTISGCTETATVNVNQFNTPVTAVAATPGPLSCNPGTLTLNGTGSSTGSDISYQWTGPGIVSGATTLNNCVVNSPGLYTLNVVNEFSGCTASAFVVVSGNAAVPTAVAAVNAPGALNCLTDTLTLSSAGSSSGAAISYSWSTPNGHFAGPANGPSVMVDSAGLYILTVTNTQNGCKSTDTVSVTANLAPPLIAFTLPAPVLNCAADSVQIHADSSASGPGFSALWTTPNGNILSGDSTLMPWVDSPGIYILSMLNSGNGCTAVDTVLISLDTIAPVVSLAPPGQLNCLQDSITLNGTGSATGLHAVPAWAFTPASGSSGQGFVSGQNSLSPVVNSPGVYTLLLIDTLNYCTAVDSLAVTQDIVAPIADAGPAPVLDCTNQTALLDGSGSSQGINFSYLWTGGDTTLQRLVSAPGLYVLTVTNTANGCSAADTVIVQLLGDLPAVAIDTPGMLTCAQTAVQLAATASAGPEFAYQWTFAGTGSGILSGDTTLTPTVGSPGIYVLTVSNTMTGCTATDTIGVAQSLTPPLAEAGAPQTLLCGAATAVLDGSLSATGPGIDYLWTTSNGNILTGDTSQMPEVNAPGVYYIQVADAFNGCFAVDSVLVVQDSNAPQADAGSPQALTCLSATAVLDGSNSSAGPAFTYLWTTQDGQILSGEATLSPVVAAAGTYLLLVTNTQNNCQTLASVQVFDQTQPPQAAAAAPQTLTCALLEFVLDGTGSSTGTNIAYQWSGPGLLSGAGTLMPLVNAAGVYTLTVTDQNNGCTATASANVAANTQPPQAAAAAPQNLTCSLPVVSLSGAGSSVGANVAYQWSGPGLVSGDTSLTPQVNAAGLYVLTVTDQTNGCTATASASVNATATPPQAIAAAPQMLTCAAVEVPLSGTGSSTGASILYQWSGPGIVSGGTTLAPLVNVAGVYTLTVTDPATGCTATATASLGENTLPPQAAAAAPQDLTCLLTQVSLSGAGSSTGNSTYQWSGPGIISGGATLVPLVNVAGVYALTVTDQTNGCTATATTSLSANTTAPLAAAAAPQGLSCLVTELSLSGAGSSTGSNFTYQWSGPGIINGGATLSPLVNLAGLYELTVTDQSNGCTATATTLLGGNTMPPQAMAAAPQGLSCLVTQVSLSGTGSSSGNNITYQWSGPGIVSGGATLAPLVNAAGVYTLTVTNQINGCTSTAVAAVAANTGSPIAGIAPPPALTCVLSELTLDAAASSTGPAFSYQWTTANGNLLSGQTGLNPVLNAPGLYVLTVTDNTNGCTATAGVVVTESLTPPDANAGPAVTLDCDTPAAALQGSSATPGALFDWTTVSGNLVSGQNSASPLVDAPGVYILTVTNPANGCTASSTVSVEEEVPVFPLVSVLAPSCSRPLGDIQFAGGQGPYLYSINNGLNFSQDSLFANLQPGVYQTAVQEPGGCEQAQTVQIPAIAVPTVLLEANLVLQAGQTLQLGPVLDIPAVQMASVVWTPGDGLSCSDCLQPLASPQANTTYTVLVTSIDGCTATATVTIQVEVPGNVYIPNAFSPNKDGHNDLFQVQTNLTPLFFELQVFDRWGGLLFRTNDPGAGWDGTARGKAMDPGVYAYVVRLEFTNGKGEKEERVLEGDVVLVR